VFDARDLPASSSTAGYFDASQGGADEERGSGAGHRRPREWALKGEETPTCPILLNYTVVNNILGTSPTTDPFGNNVPVGFYSFTFDASSVPSPVVAIMSSYKAGMERSGHRPADAQNADLRCHVGQLRGGVRTTSQRQRVVVGLGSSRLARASEHCSSFPIVGSRAPPRRYCRREKETVVGRLHFLFSSNKKKKKIDLIVLSTQHHLTGAGTFVA
jgi:hypothetical protein